MFGQGANPQEQSILMSRRSVAGPDHAAALMVSNMAELPNRSHTCSLSKSFDLVAKMILTDRFDDSHLTSQGIRLELVVCEAKQKGCQCEATCHPGYASQSAPRLALVAVVS